MPTKTKKKSTVRSSRTRVSKKLPRRSSSLVSQFRSPKALLAITIIALLGVFLVFRGSAATTNFEGESATKSGGVTTANDASASNGKYAQFTTAGQVTTNSQTQRFPGDPNPLVTNKAYWGASVGGNDDPTARHETPTGKSMALRRTFFGWDHRGANGSMTKTAKADLAANRLPWVSIKPPGGSVSSWGAMASGSYDAQIDEMLIALDDLGGPNKPVWFTMHHEPENDNGKAADWRGMQVRIRDRMNALKAQGRPMDNIAFIPILMVWTYDSASGRNPEDWWVDGIWDAFGVDPYCYNACSSKGKTLLTSREWGLFVAYAEKKKMPIAVGEWGETNSPTVWASVMREFWEYGFKNKKDIVGYAAFDSGLNPPTGDPGVDTTMPKEVLAVFHDILKNDQRVQRVNELGSSSTPPVSSYGTLTANVSVPENGTYKLWVRMSAPDTTNNAVQAQIDTGSVVRVGDGGLTPNTWTWVDYKNGDKNNKTSFSLNSGTRKVTLTGVEPGVKVDRVLLTNESCVPEGTGENCTNPTPPPPTPTASVSITSPTNGATVTGVVPVKLTSTVPVHSVSFRINDVWQTTDDTAPYEWNWDTSNLKSGSYRIVTRTRAQGDPGDVYTEKAIVVNVNNGQTPVTPPTPPRDTQAPTVPSSLRASLSADLSRFRYVMNLSWQASSDNQEVSGYEIARNGNQIGTASGTKFTDSTGLTAGQVYNYSVTATDAAGNKSPAASISLKTKCNWVFCSIEVL